MRSTFGANINRSLLLLAFMLSTLSVYAGQSGGTFDLSWFTIDGGGETPLAGGTFSAGVTVGQPDAGAHTGAQFELTGGFWGIVANRNTILSGPFAAPNPALVNELIQFSVGGNDPDIIWSWDFGDGSPAAAGTNVTHSYTAAQNFTATVTGTHFSGQIVTASVPVIVRAVAAAPGLQVTGLTATPAAGGPNIPVTLAADVNNPDGLALTYRWDFGDGNFVVSTNPATITFSGTTDIDFNVSVQVTDGVQVATASLIVPYFVPPPGSEGVINISNGTPPVSNPLNGIGVSVSSSNGGIIELAVDVDALNRDAFSVSTDFNGIGGRLATRTGTRPAHKFTEPQIAVAEVKVSEAATGLLRGKARKTLIVSNREVGKPAEVTAEPASKSISMRSMKGSFFFGRTAAASLPKPDTVQLQARIELPEGMLVGRTNAWQFAVGNIIDKVDVDPKGKQVASSSLARVKKLKVKYPKLPKGVTTTSAGLMADVTVTLSMNEMSANGFDSEGVAAGATDLDSKRSTRREIQLGMMVAGVAYEGKAAVQFKAAKDDSSGLITGRSGR